MAPPTVAAAPVADASAADARAEDAGTDAADDGDAATLPQGLAPEAIRQTVIKHRGAVQACYEAEARKNPKLKGSVRVRWVIEKSGKVTGQAIESSTLGNASVHGCLLHEVSTWTFPSSSARSSASFPFTFGHGP